MSLGLCKAQCTGAEPQVKAVMEGTGAAQQGTSVIGMWTVDAPPWRQNGNRVMHCFALIAHMGERWPGTIFKSCPGKFLVWIWWWGRVFA